MRRFVCLLLCLGIVCFCYKATASTMTATQNLFFGTWVPTGTSGSVRVSTSGTTSSVSGISAAPGSAVATQGILRFSSTGTLGAVLDVITLTPQSSSVTLAGGSGGTVTVSNFVPQGGLGVTLLNPTVDIPMGGRMSFSGTPSGTFTGSIQVVASGLLSGSATATLPISVIFWRTLNITEQTYLDFGTIEALGGAAVVNINASTGARTTTSGASNVNLVATPSPTAGTFLVSGQPFTGVSVSVSPTSISLTGSNGGSMTVNNLVKSQSGTNLDASGNMTVKVGGDLNIGVSQAAGTYSGTYTLTVNY